MFLEEKAFASAKVNLFLHVGRLDPVARKHPISSLISFADVGDHLILSLEGVKEPSPSPLRLEIAGPMAENLSDTPIDANLIFRAFQIFCQARRVEGAQESSLHLLLDKQLPIASGLGGGSSDGAAALRLFNSYFRTGFSDQQLEEMAKGLGSDGPVCVRQKTVVVSNFGEVIHTSAPLPTLNAVLINPLVVCPTAEVYNTFDQWVEEGRLPPDSDPPVWSEDGFTEQPDLESCLDRLKICRNDLEGPACVVCPEVGTILSRLKSHPLVVVARMSGSGATCFALCRDSMTAEALAKDLIEAWPDYWIVKTVLGLDLG